MQTRSTPPPAFVLALVFAAGAAAAHADTGTCSRADPNAGSYTAWDSSRSSYDGGDQVSHQGLAWEALQWTQEEPAISATVWPAEWMLLSATELKWHPERVYLEDDEADHGDRRYRAGARTQGADPSTDTSGVWTAVGAATCPVDHY